MPGPTTDALAALCAELGVTAVVGLFPAGASDIGCEDMAGNVEPMKYIAATSTIVDSTPPLAFAVADGQDLADDDVGFVPVYHPELTASRAAGEIVRRHEVLRTRFETVDGEPVQVIRPFAGLPLPVVELAALHGNLPADHATLGHGSIAVTEFTSQSPSLTAIPNESRIHIDRGAIV